LPLATGYHHMQVKICGITNLEDALTAVAAGADYVGFIFYPPSKRAVSVADAQCIVAHLRSLPNCPRLVGVFVDATAVEMTHILDHVNLDLAQLSGDEVPSLVGDPASPLYGRAYKALRPTSFAEAEADAEWFTAPEGVRPSLLIDSYHPTLRGGSGRTGDWALSARLARQVPGLMLAGGLTPENVAAAARQVRPFAVDVASGVEAAPGRKDPALVQAFVHNAKAGAATNLPTEPPAGAVRDRPELEQGLITDRKEHR
jgi:phosphoribosylanthranilate isomerase